MKSGCAVDRFVQTATGEYYRNLGKLRLFEHDLTLEYEPEKIKEIKRFPFRKYEGQILSTRILCKYCEYEIVDEKERKLLSMPSDEWEVLQFGCCELKEKFGKRTKKTIKINCMLHSALWIEIRDCQDELEAVNDDTHCPECGNFIGKSGRLFLPSIRVQLDSLIVDEPLEPCLAEKILELAKIRPIFRFTILEHNITIEHLDALLQFGKGEPFQPCVKLRLERNAHPINESLVEIELEESSRAGMDIPFPRQFEKELTFLFRENAAKLPSGQKSSLSFLRYKNCLPS